ncbi:MAG TPA: dihydroorotase, partial [Candidatus Dormibacteraeota bacterium]|nr:dihydroorotase [Candidatus Dormibacteraeota bacterium]
MLRGVRVIDPAAGVDSAARDVWIEAGRIRAVDDRVDTDAAGVIDLTPQGGAEPLVLCPGFIDLHTHLRDP